MVADVTDDTLFNLHQSEPRHSWRKLLIGQRQLTRAARQTDRHIGWLYDNIKIILCTTVHYEQLVTVTGSAIETKNREIFLCFNILQP